ncbi:MAG: hypothetical protein JNL01_04435 [Bdellovibrionales bacterium]|nr:hypothetical protein [Bdellovibrionales bacterium]
MENSEFSVPSAGEKPRSKKRIFLWVVGAFSTLLVIAVAVGIVFGPKLLPMVLHRIKPQLDGWIGAKLKEQTGWVVKYQDFQVLESGVQITGIEGQEEGTPNLFTVKKLAAEISLWPSIVALEPRFTKIGLGGIQITLKPAAEAGTDPKANAGKKTAGEIGMDSLRFFSSGAELSLEDADLDLEQKFGFQKLELRLKSSSEVSVSGRGIRADLSKFFPEQKTEFQIKDLSALASLSAKSIRLDPVLLTAPSLGADLNLVLEIPLQEKVSFRWKLDWPSAPLAAVQVWIPSHESLKGLKSWIQTAAPKGKGRISLGSDENGVSGSLDLKDASLNVAADFPRVEDFSGSVEIQGSQLKIEKAQATLMGMALTGLSVSVSEMGSPKMRVQGSSGLDAPPGRLLQFLKAGPFQETTEDWAEMAMPKKNLKGHLALSMPIKKGMGAKDVDLDFKIESLGVEIQGSEIDSFSGAIELKKGEMKLSEGKGTWAGLPFTVSGRRDPEGLGKFKFQGQAPLSLALPKKIRENFLSGNDTSGIPVQTEVDLVPAGTGSKIYFKGDADVSKLPWGGALKDAKLDVFLKGLTPIQFQASHFSGSVQTVDLESGKALEGKFKRGTDSSSLKLSLALQDVVLDPLMDLDFSFEAASGDEPKTKSPPLLMDASITASRLDYQNQSFSGFDASWKASSKTKAAFKLKSDAFSGAGDYDSAKGSTGFVKTEFAFIKLPRMFGAKVIPGAPPEDKNAPDTGKDWKTASFPSASFVCKDFQIGDQKWGKVKFDSDNHKSQYKFSGISVEGPAVQMTMDEAWINHVPARSHFKGKALVRSKFRYRFEKIQAFKVLQLQKSSLRFRFDFPGTPNRFKLVRTEASLSGWVRDGQFEEVRENSGVLVKVVNFLAGNPTQKENGIQPMYKFSMDLRVFEGQILVQFFRGLLGGVYFNVEGKSTIADEKLDLEAITRGGVDDIPDPELEEKGLIDVDPEDDPRTGKKFGTIRVPITGTWDNPKFGVSL